MGDTKETFTTSDSFKLAKSDSPIENQTVLKVCGVCKSRNTARIYFKGGGSLVGCWHEEEYKCLDCGKYTQYDYYYDS